MGPRVASPGLAPPAWPIFAARERLDMTDPTTSPTPEEVSAAALALSRRLTPEQARGLSIYLRLLEAWNARTNLVGPTRWPAMLSELVADSWRLADFLASPEVAAVFDPAGQDLWTLDFGAGAGIPGLPLRLFWPRGRYALIEPRRKRAGFLREAVARTGLGGITVFEGRAEDAPARLFPSGRPGMVACLSRAFLPFPAFFSLCRGLFGSGFAVLAMTGQALAEKSVSGPPEWPEDCRLAAEAGYDAGGGRRYVSLCIPVSAPR